MINKRETHTAPQGISISPSTNRRKNSFALTIPAQSWVKRTLASLTENEALAHLICPEDRGYSESEWEGLFRKVPFSSLFGNKLNVPNLQKLARHPLLISADLEHGAGAHLPGCTDFPWPFAIGSAHSPALTRRMGIATAIEAQSVGVNWTFSPCVDLCLNHNNPVVNIRSMGADTRSVASLASVWIQAMQRHGLAACAKHFPGDGMDDRDQHLCTSVNSLDRKVWWSTYGLIWRTVIDAGVMSIMSGHISLPAFQSKTDCPIEALPATLCSKLQIELLRNKLGFQGVIVSDAAPMIGFTSRVRQDDAVVHNILAGSDVFLFADPLDDFGRLKRARKKGLLSEDRIFQSVKRILEMKARLGLYRPVSRPMLTASRSKNFRSDAKRLAEKSIVLYRKNNATPLKLKTGNRVLTVTLRNEKGNLNFSSKLTVVDDELRRRGLRVTHRENPSHKELIKIGRNFDAIFLNFSIAPHALMGTVRAIGRAAMALWRGFWLECPQAVFTTFGSPYHIHEFPHLPNYWMICSQSEVSQRAAVRAWLGEIFPTGRCPIIIPDSKCQRRKVSLIVRKF